MKLGKYVFVMKKEHSKFIVLPIAILLSCNCISCASLFGFRAELYNFKLELVDIINSGHHLKYKEVKNGGKTTITITGSTTSSTSLARLTIPASINGKPVTVIGESAFQGYDLISLKLPNGLETIEDSAFLYTKLKRVSIPTSVTAIHPMAFHSNELTSFTVSSGNQIYSSRRNTLFSKDGKTLIAYYGKDGVNYTIPDGVISIGDEAFWNKKITNVHIPEGVTYIGKQAFGHNQLTRIIIPQSTVSIGERAFTDSSQIELRNFSLKSIDIPAGLDSLGNFCFPYIFDEVYSSTGRLEGNYTFSEQWNRWDRNGTALMILVKLIIEYNAHIIKINEKYYHADQGTIYLLPGLYKIEAQYYRIRTTHSMARDDRGNYVDYRGYRYSQVVSGAQREGFIEATIECLLESGNTYDLTTRLTITKRQ